MIREQHSKMELPLLSANEYMFNEIDVAR